MDPDAAKRLMELLLKPENGAGESVGGEGDPMTRPGFAIPGFDIERLIGEGASGQVWLAHWSRSDRPVAIKVLRRKLGEGKQAQRAWRELALLDEVRLPCVPHLLDYGTHDGRMYFATEFVEGERIDRHAEQHALGARERVELLERLARAVGELHARGVLHRDLKPSNILITPTRDPVIIDLGIASMLAGDVMETLTSDGAPIGTPAFMAPEQARGERSKIGTWSDVYALGAIGYLLLTGATPHDLADTTLFEAVRRVGHDEPRQPSKIDATVPAALSAVLHKACAADSRTRYQSANDLADDLHRWLSREPVLACRPNPWQRAARWAGKHPLMTTSALGGVVVLLTAAAVLAITWVTLRRPDSVKVSHDHKTVTLESVTGQTLRRWQAERDERSVCFTAARVRIPDLDGFFVAVAALGTDTSPAEQAIGVFRDMDPDQHLWVLRNEEAGLVVPEDILSMQGEHYRAQLQGGPEPLLFNVMITAADVFEEEPGDEIIAWYSHVDLSPSCLRVLRGRDGATLYEIWHDGHCQLNGLDWIPRARLIAFYATANSLWRAQGEPFYDSNRPPYPFALIAIRPELGVMHHRSLTSPDVGDECSAVWFEGRWSLEWFHRLPNAEMSRYIRGDARNVARLGLATNQTNGEPDAGVGCYLTADGSMSVRVADTWLSAFPGLAPPATAAELGIVDVTGYDPKNGKLGDWPPKDWPPKTGDTPP